MAKTKVEELYKDYKQLEAYLKEKNQPSLVSYVDDNFRKVILIASASYFEEEIKNLLIEFSKKTSDSNEKLIEFVKNTVLVRQYCNLFDWKVNNCNTFLKLFGNEFKEECNKEIEKDGTLKEAIGNFIEIGRTRNILVHQNFATILIEKNADEWYDSYKKAIDFIEFLKKKLL